MKKFFMINLNIKHALTCLFLLLLVFPGTKTYGQQVSPDDVNTAQSSFMEAMQGGNNIRVGAGYGFQRIHLKGNRTSFGPNTFGLFLAYDHNTRITRNVSLDLSLVIGRGTFTRSHDALQEEDRLTIFNAEEFKYVYGEAPAQLTIKSYIGNHIYWAVKPGVSLHHKVDGLGELKNRDRSEDNVRYDHLSFIDFGAILGFEFGVRGGYVGMEYRYGWDNTVKEEYQGTHTVQNVGFLSIYAGYKFGSDVGAADADRVQGIMGRFR